MNIVFAGTPDFAIPALEALQQSNHNISLVISQKDRPRGRGKKMIPTPVKKRALELGLETYEPASINSKEAIEKLEEIAPDCIIVVAFGQILKKELLNLAKYKCLNIHASLLPKYRGAAPINWAIINGEKETGISIMRMDQGLDTGPVLKQEAIPIREEDDSISIHDKLAQLGAKMIVGVLSHLETGEITEIPQDDSLSNYAPMLNKEMGRIDWSNKGLEIHNLIKGLKPWPSAYTFYGGENIKIHQAKRMEKFQEADNGRIVKVSDEGLFVNCQDQCIVIEELQFPGKRKMHVSDYLKGNEIDRGVKLI